MNTGTVVSLYDGHWVLIHKTFFKAKGVVRTKVLRKLNPAPNMACEEKPYTHAREALCTACKLSDLNKNESEEFQKLKAWKFNVRV